MAKQQKKPIKKVEFKSVDSQRKTLPGGQFVQGGYNAQMNTINQHNANLAERNDELRKEYETLIGQWNANLDAGRENDSELEAKINDMEELMDYGWDDMARQSDKTIKSNRHIIPAEDTGILNNPLFDNQDASQNNVDNNSNNSNKKSFFDNLQDFTDQLGSANSDKNSSDNTNTSLPTGSNSKQNLDSKWSSEKELGLLGGLAGLGLGLYSNIAGGEEQGSHWEGQAAQDQNTANRERLLALDPEANRRTSEMANREAEAGAMQSALASGASAANAGGMGGEVNSALLMGMKTAGAGGQVASQFAQGRTGLQAQKAQEELAGNQALMQNTGQRFQIDDSRNYYTRDKSTLVDGLLPMIQGGLKTGLDLATVGNSNDKTINSDGNEYSDDDAAKMTKAGFKMVKDANGKWRRQ